MLGQSCLVCLLFFHWNCSISGVCKLGRHCH